MKSSNRDSAALSIASGLPGLYSLIASAGWTTLTQIQTHASQLMRVADFAYGRRDVDTMECASRGLANLPLPSAQSASVYYFAMSARRQGRRQEARTLLAHVVEAGELRFKARAIQALGTIEHEEGRADEALRLYIEAARISRESDASTFINSQLQFSAIKSLNGDHGHALDDLYSLWPVLRIAAKHHPHLWPMLHNEIAFEFLQLGKVKEARHAAALAVSSPIADQYPEWQETARDVEAATSQAILVIVPAQPQRQRPQSKLIIRFQLVESSGRRRFIKPTIRRAPTIRSILERVAMVAPIHAPPDYRK